MSDLLELIEPDAKPVEINDGVRRYSVTAETNKQAVNASAMSADFVILTIKVNHHGNAHQIGESNLGKGMLTERHQANPVVLLEHGFGGLQFPVIGLSQDEKRQYTVTKLQSKAKATVFFSQANPDAATVFAMVDEGTFHMASIGFDARKGVPMKQQKPPKLEEGVLDLSWTPRGLLFTETELVEWSIVSQGADPGAVRQYLDRGHVAGEKLTDPMKFYLQSLAAPNRAWAPGIDLSADDPWVIIAMDQREQIQSLREERENIRRQRAELQSQVQDLQSALDTNPPASSLPSSPGENGEGAESSQASSPPPDLGKQFRERESQKTNQQQLEQFQKSLTQAMESLIEKKVGELADSQKQLESELDRHLGVMG